MIPSFDIDGLLPPGIHWATWNEIIERFGYTQHRKRLLSGLKNALIALKEVGCKFAYLDGSFVTFKLIPNDFDACWEADGVNLIELERKEPILLQFSNGRVAQKSKFMGELFLIENNNINNELTFLEFFQIDKETGKRKGIVGINLEEIL